VGCGVWGETIHNLRVNHTIKKGFGITHRKRVSPRNPFSPHALMQKGE
jgi:hypothetical protein